MPQKTSPYLGRRRGFPITVDGVKDVFFNAAAAAACSAEEDEGRWERVMGMRGTRPSMVSTLWPSLSAHFWGSFP